MAKPNFNDDHLNLKATELRLGLPGADRDDHNNKKKRSSSDLVGESSAQVIQEHEASCDAPAPKAQVIGWPPVRSYRKNALNNNSIVGDKSESKTSEYDNGCAGIYVKVSMDGAPYLRKIDLKCYKSYAELLKALRDMFKCAIGVYSEREGYDGSQHAPAYQDKDGDLMLVGDVPWDMFVNSCKRLRIMKGFEAKGLGGCCQ